MEEFRHVMELVESVAVTVAAVATTLIAIVAWFQLLGPRKIAARRATLDFIVNLEVHNTQWATLRTKFNVLKDAGTLTSLVAHSGQDRNDMVIYLNHFELVAVAIKHKIIDEDLYKHWFRTTYIETWNDAAPFVNGMREKRKNPRLCLQFEQLATKWCEDSRKRKDSRKPC